MDDPLKLNSAKEEIQKMPAQIPADWDLPKKLEMKLNQESDDASLHIEMHTNWRHCYEPGLIERFQMDDPLEFNSAKEGIKKMLAQIPADWDLPKKLELK